MDVPIKIDEDISSLLRRLTPEVVTEACIGMEDRGLLKGLMVSDYSSSTEYISHSAIRAIANALVEVSVKHQDKPLRQCGEVLR